MKKRLLSVLLSVCMVTAILPTFSSTAFAAGTVTRSEWISRLVEAFSMTVESDDNMPDNYFSDISEDDSCYQDILLAVEFGVIDLEAGEAFEPDADATREFAAQTLNSCLQFQLDEDEEYTYSEADSVTYPDDIQIAINRNWFALSGGSFLPEQAVTTTEADAMLADAAEVIAGDVIDENYENKFEFAEGVIEIPESADVTIDENNTVTITGNDKEINVGDVFVVYSMGIPVALKATTVETADGATIISATKDGAENAIVSADAQGRIAIGIENFKPEEATTYSILNTKTNQTEEMGIQLCEIDYDKDTSTVTASHNITIGAGIAGSIVAKISNIYLDYKKDGLDFEVILTGDVNITTSVSFDFNDYAGIPKSVRLGSVPVAGIGKIALDVECSISGGIAMSWDGALKAGVEGTVFKDIRFIKSFTKKDFTVTAEVNIGLGLKLSAGVDIFIASGTIFAEIGANGSVKATGYSSGTPVECATIKAYMYASVGADVKILGWKPNIQPIDIFTEKNSPIRACYHYEDGKLVEKCTRGAAEAGDAYTAYTTPTNSKYFNPSPSYGQSSYGGSGSGSGGSGGTSEPVVIWEYKLDDDNNATITGYKGNASAIAIPSKIDGYTVTKIGDNAFKYNKTIKTVIIPDNITYIGGEAFYDCTSLSNVVLSKNLETLEYNVFCGCTNLTSIEIPKSLKNAGSSRYIGTFAETGLKNVTFEEGITQIPDNLFKNCESLEHISLPDTITTIGSNVFEHCTLLKEIILPDNITYIGGEAFYECTSLSNVILPKNLETLEYNVFCGCTNLTSIEIPKSLKDAGSNRYIGTFARTGLKNVTFEDGITQIPDNLFKNCESLEHLSLPDTIITIGSYVFEHCTLLKEIMLSDNITYIGSGAFCECTSLKEIDIPNSVTTIDEEAFLGCSSLTGVYLPEGLSRLGYGGNSWGACGVFKNCSSLTTVYIPSTLKDVETFANDEYGNFYGCSQLKNVIWGDGITAVPDGLFRGCSGIETISIPNTVISINPTAFTSCESLVSIDIPNSVTTIGDSAFENCISLKEIDIPNSVTTIDEEAFLGCTSLTEIVIPDSVTSMEDYIFSNCSSLKKIDIPKTVTAIRSNAFSGCGKLENVVFPASLETIENNAFYECSSLEEINIPSSVTSVGSSAFYNCDSLTSVTTGMTGSIDAQVFYDCDALTTLELGDGVTEIGSELCRGCDKLSTVKLGKYITTIPDSAFRQCQSLETITLPRFCTTVAANSFAEDTKLASAYVPVSVSKIETTSFSYPMKMTMYGKSGSYAEEYADSRNMAFNAVNAPITNIKYADSSISIGRNATVRPQLDIEPAFDTSVVTFSTSDNKILTVSDTGLVKGVNYGTATITATADSGKSTSIEITVLKTATKLELDKTSLSLEQGQSDTLSVTMTPSDAADKLNWSSSNSEVATVDENGKITAVGVGTAVITVTAEYSSVSASCTVEVVGDVTITASAGEHGKITPSGEVSVKSNAKTTFTIIPDYGYVVKNVQVNGASVGVVESYTFSNPKDNATIHADFAAVNVSYENGDVVITSEAKLDNLKLIIAEYNDDNSLSDCKIETVTAEPNVEHHVLVSPTSKYKLMLWSSMDTMRPIWMYESV